MSESKLDGFDPWDCAVADDPYPYHQLLREESPVHQVQGLWLLSRYDDIRAALRNTEVYSNNSSTSANLSTFPTSTPSTPSGTPNPRSPHAAPWATTATR